MNKRQYIEYLIATPNNYTCTNLANHLQGEQTGSHDAVSDYLRREKLTPRGLWEVVAPLLHDSPEAYLVVDDSVQDKCYSTKMTAFKTNATQPRQMLLNQDFMNCVRLRA